MVTPSLQPHLLVNRPLDDCFIEQKLNNKLLNMRTLEADWYRQEDSSLVYSSNLYVTNIFDRVDSTANICQQFN